MTEAIGAIVPTTTVFFCRFAHRAAFSQTGVRLALIARPSRNRRRSSARACTSRHAGPGLYRHIRMIVSRSLGMSRRSDLGGGGSAVNICMITSWTVADSKTGRPVASS